MHPPRPLGLRRRLGSTLTALLLTAGGIGALGSGPARAADGNLLANPGFENGLANWTCSGDSGSTVSSPVHGGQSALKATPGGQDDARCTQTVAVKPNSQYQLSAWVRGSYVYLGAGGTGTTDVSTWTPNAGDWQQLNTTFTTGADTTSVTVYLHGWYGQPAYFADDLALTGPGGGPNPPGGQVPAAPDGLTVGAVTPSSVALSWNPVPGATGYTVYRDGAKVQSVNGTSATVTGLAPGTAYRFQVTAANSAGESALSAAVTATTGTGGGGPSLPRHALTGYWQNFDNGATVQKLTDVPDAYDIIAVAFADATSTPGAVDFTLDPALHYGEDRFKADIAAKRAAGKSVVLSVGGEKGSVSVNDASSAENFASSVYALMQRYGFNGVDIDLENGLNPTYMTQALRSLSAKAGSGLVITMAPQTIDMQSPSAGYFRTALNIKDILTVVNTQFYNSGSMNGCDGNVYAQGTVDFLTALACVQLEGGLSPSQVGLGVPASSRAAGSGYVDPSVVNRALDCLAGGTGCGSFKPPHTYPGIRGAMTWSTNWDAAAGNGWSSAVGPHVHGLP
ncbi:chitinase [Streptomyces orinoci]|uniref:chitinase n=1 Tax=Streptomyces orinoci TaxID=67339 RepID=A0ABV3JSC5_STRON|nr:glycoside hydrolase family 18 protein [Streptomyces orinoci]